MLKFQTVTKEDLRLAASIQRRRQTDAERKQRIFNPQWRKIGIDKEFLDKQVAEKKQQRELELARESELDENLIRSSKLACLLEKQQEEEKRKISKEIEEYRRQYQRAEQREAYDLEVPGVSRRDGGCGFGEKLQDDENSSKERSKSKKEEMRFWIEKQIAERARAETERQEIEKSYQAEIISRDKRVRALDQLDQDCRRRLNEATARFNRALAEEQEYRRRCEALQDEEDKKAEIYNHVTGDFLMEAKEQAESTRGPSKPLATRYKGMTAEEIKAFREAQAQQLQEIERMKLDERRKSEEWDRLMKTQAQLALSYQREMDQRRWEMKKKIAQENLELAQQQKSHQEYLNQVMYKNKPTAEFFEQFNKDAR